jgi:F0F1-type ATP synthase assembly protein I
MYWATRVSSVGFAMVLPTALGYWLDSKWGTAPWLVILGACIGFATAMLDLMKLAKRLEKPGPGHGSARQDDASV